MKRLSLLMSLLLTLAVSGANSFRVIGYLMEWRPIPSEEKIGNLTHLIFTGTTVGEGATLDTTTTAKLDEVVAKANKVGTEVMIMVGGWGRCEHFSAMAASDSLRNKFAKELTNYCINHNIAGADIDWEFPNVSEMDNYEKMMKAIETEFETHNLLLTAAMGADKGGEFTSKTWDYIDWVNLMTYDRNWAAKGSAMPGPHSPKDQVNSLSEWHTTYDIAKEKLVLGLPFYARNSMDWGDAKAYSELYNTYKPAPNQDSIGGYNYNGPHMIEYKTHYTKKSGYGGVMVWEIEHDLAPTHEHSLLKAINDAVDTTIVDDSGDIIKEDSSYIDTSRYDGFKLVAYFPVNGKIEDMDEVDFLKLSHVIGAFIQANEDGSLHYPGWKYDPNKTSQEAEEEMLDSLIVRAKRNGVVPMVALGTTADGWKMTESASARTACVNNIKALLVEKGLLGVDLDLEGGNNPEGYGLLAKELRDSLGDDFIITSAVSANKKSVPSWSDTMLEALNWVNVMVYDIRVWNSVTIANQSLFDDQVKAAGFWEERGLRKEQIVFGVPFYSRGWDYDNQKPYIVDVCWAPNHSADSSTWNWSQISTFSYQMMHKKFDLAPDQDSILVTPNDQMWVEDGWTGYKGTAKGVLYYNGPNLITKKSNWAQENGYGGMMIWELTGDIPTTNSASLLGAMARALEDSGSTSIISDVSVETLRKNSISLSGNQVILHLNEGSYRVSLTDLRGREITLIANSSFPTGVHTFNLQNISTAAGVYIITCKEVYSQNIVQQKLLLQ